MYQVIPIVEVSEDQIATGIIDGCFVNKERNILDFIVKIFDIGIGITAPIYNIFYSYNLGRSINFGVIGSIFLGVSSYVPLAVLSCMSCSDVFDKIVARESKHLQKLSNITFNMKLEKVLRVSSLAFLALFGTIPMVFVNHTAFAPYSEGMAITLDISVAIARFVVYVWSINKMYMSIKEFGHDLYLNSTLDLHSIDEASSVRDKVYYLRMQLKKIAVTLKKLKIYEIEILFSTLCINKDNELNLDKINRLIDFLNIYQKEPPINIVRRISRFSMGFLGCVTGFFGTYLMVSLGQNASQSICDDLKINSEFSKIFSITFGWITGVCCAPLLMTATKDSFQQFYDACLKMPGILARIPELCRNAMSRSSIMSGLSRCVILRKVLMALSIVFAVTSSIPRMELSIENINVNPAFDKMVQVAVVLTAISKDFWSLDSFFDRIFSHRDKQKFLLNKIDQIIDKLYFLKPAAVCTMFSIFKNRELIMSAPINLEQIELSSNDYY